MSPLITEPAATDRKRSIVIFLHSHATYLLIGLLLCFAVPAKAQNVDSLLLVLDTCVAQKSQYEQLFQKQANSIRDRAENCTDMKKALQLWTELGREEFRHSGDEALKATNKALALALLQSDKRAEATLLELKAATFGMMGFPWEGERLLDSIARTPELSTYLREQLYASYYDLYDFYKVYDMPGELKDPKYAFLSSIEDSVRKNLKQPARQAMTIEYATYDEKQMINSLKTYLKQAPDKQKGIIATVISNKYALIRDIRNRNYYWALAAIYNLKVARHDNEALILLAVHLFETGDTDRAMRYFLAAYDDARIYNTSIRKMKLAQPLAQGLEQELRHNEELAGQLTGWRFALAGMALLLVGMLIGGWLYVRRQRLFRQNNYKLLSEQQTLITRLRKETGVKNDYITRFLELSLDSIFQIEQLRNLLLIKAKNGETERLLKTLKDPAHFDDFRRICLQRFDIAFLRLYPDFIQTVNSLILPEEQIKLPDTEFLNNELRVLAFLRLGITDSPRIATILGVSTNTIYFYRSKLRRMATDRNNFEKSIMLVHKDSSQEEECDKQENDE